MYLMSSENSLLPGLDDSTINIDMMTMIIIIILVMIMIIIFKNFGGLGTYNPEGVQILRSSYKMEYDHQSVAGKLSCKRTALKRCTKIEILKYRKLVSRASPLFLEISHPRSSR